MNADLKKLIAAWVDLLTDLLNFFGNAKLDEFAAKLDEKAKEFAA